jgi:hypothetical protein
MKKLLFSAALFAVSFTTVAQVGVGTMNPEAVLDIVSTNSGVLLPRVANIAAVTTPVNGMIIYDLSTKCFKGFENGAWTSCFSTPNGITYIVSSTGRLWMDRNLGATQVAASSTDAASYGDLYQWGRAKDGHQSRTSSTTTTFASTTDAGDGVFIIAGGGTDNNWTDFTDEDDLWQAGLNDPCPTGYRIPTETEIETERANFSSNDANGAFSALKLPLTGIRSGSDGTISTVGVNGRYWTSKISGTSARHFGFSNVNAGVGTTDRAAGLSVRCIKD